MIYRRLSRTALLPLTLLSPSLTFTAHAQIDPAIEVTVLVSEGDSVTGVGSVTNIMGVTLNSAGETLVHVDTDHADTTQDNVVLKNGSVFLREGMAMTAPAGATLGFVDALGLSASGDVAWNASLGNTSSTGDDAGVFWNTSLLIQEGAPVTAPGVTAGTFFSRFWETSVNDIGELLVNASVDDPSLPGNLNAAMVLVNPSTGVQSLLLLEGQPAGGLPGATLSFFSDAPGTFDRNESGDLVYYADTDLPDGMDGVIYKNQQVLAQEGTPSVVPGRNWANLAGPSIAVNKDGDTVFSARLDGDFASSSVIVRDGALIAQTGTSLPATNGAPLTFFGSGPVLLADRGEATDDDPDVLWYGTWNHPTLGFGAALFLNDKPIVRAKQDSVGGVLIDAVHGFTRAYGMGSDGRRVACRVRLIDGTDLALLIDRGPWRSAGHATSGATGKPRLRGFGQLKDNTPLTVELTHARPNSTATLILGLSRVDFPFLSGTLVPSPDVLAYNLPIGADGSLSLSYPWPAGLPAGAKVYMQYWVNDPTAPASVAASNAIEGTVQ